MSANYGNYAIIPLDVQKPPLDAKKLKKLIQHRCHFCEFTNNSIRYISLHVRKYVKRNAVTRYLKGSYCWDKEFVDTFPSFQQWLKLLPFNSIGEIIFVTQTDDITDHVDIFGDNNSITYYKKYISIEPKEYRVIIQDDSSILKTQNNFYVAKDFEGKKHYLNFPPATNSFVLNSSCCYHGSSYHKGLFKTTLVIHGELNQNAHHNLLQRSIEKYREYTIYFDQSGPAKGPAEIFPYPGPHPDNL